MNNPTGSREARSDTHLSYAVVVSGTLIAISIVVAALTGSDSNGLMPNPQGGIWIERGGALYLCQARPDGPARCVNAADGATLAYGDIPR
ncbi:MAG: hypothetical protein U0942_08270 [Parvibaculum sp.]|uniref:hypothetical protein n=1 Tax=Parvibaculum sp. TaxID=2024848 RepID=UPI002AB9A16A|nr:hypothetical protein [Parvibaculum sp.]MDZ4381319.1 hypothetical protein [Parvibaculum sp.]